MFAHSANKFSNQRCSPPTFGAKYFIQVEDASEYTNAFIFQLLFSMEYKFRMESGTSNLNGLHLN